MPTFVFTYHGKMTWMPDHPDGYVKRGKGILPPDEQEAARYRSRATSDEFHFNQETQQLLIDETQTAARFQNLIVHMVATEPTHIHVLVGWNHDKQWKTVSGSIKSSLTRALRKHARDRGENTDRLFFSHGSSRKCITSEEHFEYWMHEYGPSHSGLKWRSDVGVFQ